MDKMDTDGGSKTQRLYRCGSNYALSKLIMDNVFEDLWRRENPDSSELTHYDRYSGTRSRIDNVYIDIILFYVSPSSPQLQRICLFVKNIKDAILKQVIGGNTSILALKRILEYFLEIPPLKEILELKN